MAILVAASANQYTSGGIAMLDHLAGGDFTALPRLCQELVLAQRQLTPFTDVLFGHIAEAMCLSI